MTTALAIWGAVVATVLAILELRKQLRERPRLAVRLAHHANDQGTFLGVTVVNQPGAQATTIVQAGFEIDSDSGIQKIGEPWEDPAEVDRSLQMGLSKPGDAVRGRWAQILSEEVCVLEPGHHRHFEIKLSSLPRPLGSVATPIRPFVVDAEGHATYGKAEPVFRALLDGGWHPSISPPADDPFRISAFRPAPEATRRGKVKRLLRKLLLVR